MPQFLKRLAVSALLVFALAAIGSSPALAIPVTGGHMQVWAAKPISKNDKQDSVCREAAAVRGKVIKQFGKRAPGRDVCKYGLPSGKKPSMHQKEHYLQTLKRMLAPPPQAVVRPAPRYSQSASASSSHAASGPTSYSSTGSVHSSSVGGGGLPSCASESGTNYSTGPANTNSSSGATGRYQITPGTAANYGCSLSTPAGQDACAEVIYAHQGEGAWVGCGG
jgi:hypothetical protein